MLAVLYLILEAISFILTAVYYVFVVSYFTLEGVLFLIVPMTIWAISFIPTVVYYVFVVSYFTLEEVLFLIVPMTINFGNLLIYFIWYSLLPVFFKTLVTVLPFLGDFIVHVISVVSIRIVHLSQTIVYSFGYMTLVAVTLVILLYLASCWRLIIESIVVILELPFFMFQSNRPHDRAYQSYRPTNGTSSPFNESIDPNPCIVCRDCPKCVLLLPCKHLCMCDGCDKHMVAIGKTLCPICRRAVTNRMSIYI